MGIGKRVTLWLFFSCLSIRSCIIIKVYRKKERTEYYGESTFGKCSRPD